MRVAQDAGALTSAGLAALTLIEEHGATWRLSEYEVLKVYLRADELLRDTQDAEDIARLRACAHVAVKRLSGARLHDKNFSRYGAMHELEATLIEQALEETSGSKTKSEKLFGLKLPLAAVGGGGQDTCAPGVVCKRVATRADYTPCPGRRLGFLMTAAGLDAHSGVIAGGRYAGIKTNAPKWASLPAACSTST